MEGRRAEKGAAPIGALHGGERSGFFRFVHVLNFRQHALVKDTRDQNTARLPTVKHNVLSLFRAMQARAYRAAVPAQCGIFGQALAAKLEIIQITNSLSFTPGTQCVFGNVQKIGFGPV